MKKIGLLMLVLLSLIALIGCAARSISDRWRKLKGVAPVRLQRGRVCKAEVHWYEAHGIGRKKMKIKRILD
jgi:hypothetical protein